LSWIYYLFICWYCYVYLNSIYFVLSDFRFYFRDGSILDLWLRTVLSPATTHCFLASLLRCFVHAVFLIPNQWNITISTSILW
jgi:hypothetical protein